MDTIKTGRTGKTWTRNERNSGSSGKSWWQVLRYLAARGGRGNEEGMGLEAWEKVYLQPAPEKTPKRNTLWRAEEGYSRRQELMITHIHLPNCTHAWYMYANNKGSEALTRRNIIFETNTQTKIVWHFHRYVSSVVKEKMLYTMKSRHVIRIQSCRSYYPFNLYGHLKFSSW